MDPFETDNSHCHNFLVQKSKLEYVGHPKSENGRNYGFHASRVGPLFLKGKKAGKITGT